MPDTSFHWPGDKRVAVSISVDDARASQVEVGFPLLEALGAKATFYVLPSAVEPQVELWRAVAAAGHEIGNHSVRHPCSGNFSFAREKALESYTLEQMEAELLECNGLVHDLIGVVPRTFAYPCGQTFVGRGEATRSYVPIVAKHFLAGRVYMSEWYNTPGSMDRAQLYGRNFDGVSFETFQEWVKLARGEQGWIVLAGHNIGDGSITQTVDTEVLRRVCDYCLDPENGVWLDTVERVAWHVKQQEQTSSGTQEQGN